MKFTKSNIVHLALSLTLVIVSNSCTDLDEKLYDRITSDSFIQTKDDVIRDFLRSFEHGYWSIQGGGLYYAQELPTDELMTPNRDGDWFDGGIYQRIHYHTWTDQDNFTNDMWNALYQGISLATNSLEDITKIDPVKFGLTEADKNDYIAELRTLRAWYHLRAFDLYRYIPLVTKVKGESFMPDQSTPQEIFDFIEKELTESIPDLPTRESLGESAIGRWTKGGAAALLVRLYLNAKVYIDQDKFAECAAICEKFMAGEYGAYQLEDRWDAPFDYTNTTSPELVFGFPSSFSRTHWHYSGDMFGWMAPHQAGKYFGLDGISYNTRFALQPGRDVDSVEYPFAMGKPFMKFQKYPDDFRLKKYRNLGNSTREGMFLYGYLPYKDAGTGEIVNVKSNRGYTIFSRDQVGFFKDTPPGQPLADKVSNMNHADDNSGVWLVKYPFYPTADVNKLASAYAEIRYAEIYYSLAECRYRAGDKAAASELLNAVRQRNYPAASPSLYATDGSELTDIEMLDEWGREFIGEGRRRTDLIRWNKFNTEPWWDKTPDPDDHTKIYPIGKNIRNLSPNLKPTPGY